jgi:hypothetical protein
MLYLQLVERLARRSVPLQLAMDSVPQWEEEMILDPIPN